MMHIIRGQQTGLTRIVVPIAPTTSEQEEIKPPPSRAVLETMLMAELRHTAKFYGAKSARSKKALIKNILATIES